MSEQRQDKVVGKGSPHMETLSKECTEQIESLTKMKDLLFIVAYSANAKPEQVVLAYGHTPGTNNCEEDTTAYTARSGTCKGVAFTTCKWVNINNTMYWVCA